jgi:hypothetical protein
MIPSRPFFCVVCHYTLRLPSLYLWFSYTRPYNGHLLCCHVCSATATFSHKCILHPIIPGPLMPLPLRNAPHCLLVTCLPSQHNLSSIFCTSRLLVVNHSLTPPGLHPEPRERGNIHLDIKTLRPYRYSKLRSKTSFRPLEFTIDEVAFPDDYSSQKICHLVTFKRATAPLYLCLSYTCGS